MVTVIGRGHSGTRVIAETLRNSGVYMGNKFNKSSDFIPAKYMYWAAKINKHVKYKGHYKWDFSYLKKNEPSDDFKDNINRYLKPVLDSKSEHKGWKLPETVFAYPWLIKMFPDMNYIIWNRHPYDSVLSPHKSDRFDVWRIDFPLEGIDEHMHRAVSWKYQYEIIRSTPPPKNIIHVKYEDFVKHPVREKRRLEKFLGISLKLPKLYTSRVERWRREPSINYNEFSFLRKPMRRLGYNR